MTDDTGNSGESDNISTDKFEKLDRLGPNRHEVMAQEVENARKAENSIDECRDASDTGRGSTEEAEATNEDTGEAETGAEDSGMDDDDR